MAMLNKNPVRLPSSPSKDSVDLYWFPQSISANLVQGRLDVNLGLFNSKADKDLGAASLDFRGVTFSAAEKAYQAPLAKLLGSGEMLTGENARKLLWEIISIHPDLEAYGLASDEA